MEPALFGVGCVIDKEFNNISIHEWPLFNMTWFQYLV